MSDNISLNNLTAEPQIPNTRGMTAKVFKGSLWTFIGQILPLAASFFGTYFVIRLLGAESYGVYLLVILIPTYFTFADLGMSLGSTKFGAEAYAEGAREGEGKVVRTAAAIAFFASLPFAAAIFIFSHFVIVRLEVPAHLHSEASLALKITCITFVLNILCNVFNTPQLSRLRMDLNTFVNAGFRLLGIVLVPIVLYVGWGIVGAVSVLLSVAILTLLGHIFVSGRLLKELFRFSIERDLIRPLLKFGYPWAISGIAAILLVNLEKIVLTRLTSVKDLAYYSVAYLLANTATLLSGSLIQSLIPAFSQLLKPEKKEELNELFARSLKINLIGIVPILMFLFVAAEPFFTIWAGADFGRESSLPFYVLLFGLFSNVIAYIPYSVLLASGRTDFFAKIYWLELFPYILLLVILTAKFGAVGAAAAWSVRVMADMLIIVVFAKKFVGVSFDIFDGKFYVLPLLILVMISPVLIVAFIGNYSLWLLFSIPVCVFVYFVITWKNLLEESEKNWLRNKFRVFTNKRN